MNKPYSLMREKFVSTELRNPPEAVFVQDAADSEMKIDKETAERVLKACGYEFDFSCPRCAELEKALVMAEEAIQLIYSWAANWDSEFMNDPDWRNMDYLEIQAALTKIKEVKG